MDGKGLQLQKTRFSAQSGTGMGTAAPQPPQRIESGMSLLRVIVVGGGQKSKEAQGLVRYCMSSFGMPIRVIQGSALIRVDSILDVRIAAGLAVLMATPTQAGLRVHQDRGQLFPL